MVYLVNVHLPIKKLIDRIINRSILIRSNSLLCGSLVALYGLFLRSVHGLLNGRFGGPQGFCGLFLWLALRLDLVEEIQLLVDLSDLPALLDRILHVACALQLLVEIGDKLIHGTLCVILELHQEAVMEHLRIIDIIEVYLAVLCGIVRTCGRTLLGCDLLLRLRLLVRLAKLVSRVLIGHAV